MRLAWDSKKVKEILLSISPTTNKAEWLEEILDSNYARLKGLKLKNNDFDLKCLGHDWANTTKRKN